MKTRFITKSAIIAALYVALTLMFSELSFGNIQVRLGEILTILPYFSASTIPGLTVGCLIANIIGASASLTPALDIIIGTLATLVSAILSYALRKNKFLVPLPPVLINAIVVGLQLKYIVGIELPVYILMLQVLVGQVIACYIVGVPLIFITEKNKQLKEMICK